jgi:hypothetical protein
MQNDLSKPQTDMTWKVDPDKYIYLDDFISRYSQDIKDIHNKHPYIAFGLICAGIEFLGKCLDENHKFSDYKWGLTSKQFNNAIETLMPKYNTVNRKFKLYQTLRNSFLHALLPKGQIWLRGKENTTDKHLAFKKIHGKERLVLIIQDFYSDFDNACLQVIKKINDGELKHPKINKALLIIKE